MNYNLYITWYLGLPHNHKTSYYAYGNIKNLKMKLKSETRLVLRIWEE